jgi:hypothetical protein
VDISFEGDIVQHTFVTADTPKEEDDKEVESATKEYMMINTVWGNCKVYTRNKLADFKE